MTTKTTSRPITILLVDDDPDCRMLVRDIIAMASARADVREAPGGREALAYLRSSRPGGPNPRPDLVYLDVEMPGMSGLDVLRALRAEPALRDVPVVMLTGVDDPRARREALDAGAGGYVLKPSEPRRFLNIVTASVRQCLADRAGAAVRAAYGEHPGEDQGDE